MMGTRLAWLAGAMVALATWSQPGWARDAGDCGRPPSLEVHVGELPKLGQRLNSGQPIKIAVLATAMGGGLKGLDEAYPARFQAYLLKRLPKLKATVAIRINAGETAEEMLASLKDALTHKPDLVIWQTGTIDAVQQVDAANFADALTRGRAMVREVGGELVLIGPQFSRHAGALVEFRPYIEEMAHVEQGYGTPFLDRFSIMRYWADRGLVNLEGGRETWAASAAFVHDCMGMFLVGLVLRAAGADVEQQ
jgi:hypothetical protein